MWKVTCDLNMNMIFRIGIPFWLQAFMTELSILLLIHGSTKVFVSFNLPFNLWRKNYLSIINELWDAVVIENFFWVDHVRNGMGDRVNIGYLEST